MDPDNHVIKRLWCISISDNILYLDIRYSKCPKILYTKVSDKVA